VGAEEGPVDDADGEAGRVGGGQRQPLGPHGDARRAAGGRRRTRRRPQLPAPAQRRHGHHHAVGGNGQHLAAEDIDRPEELGGEAVDGLVIDLLRRAQLGDAAVAHQCHPVGHDHGLLRVVGDDQAGHAHAAQDGGELELHLGAQLAVEGAHGLVEQQQLRRARKAPGQRHALLLATGQLVRAAVAVVGHADEAEQLGHPGRAPRPVPASLAEAEAHVLRHRQVREQRVGLEHQVDRPAVRRLGGDVAAVDADAPAVGLLEAGQDPQQRRLAAARRPQQREDLAAGQTERHAAQRHHRPEGPGDAVDGDEGGRRRHRPVLTAVQVRVMTRSTFGGDTPMVKSRARTSAGG
jgi:hypothetical protein